MGPFILSTAVAQINIGRDKMCHINIRNNKKNKLAGVASLVWT